MTEAGEVIDRRITTTRERFGSVFVGTSADRAVVLRNVGSDPLNISGVSFTDPQYSLVGGTLPAILGQNGSVNLTVRFTPVSDWTVGSACPPPTAVPANELAMMRDQS